MPETPCIKLFFDLIFLAFFRRSVSQKRSYFCRQNNACNVDESKLGFFENFVDF